MSLVRACQPAVVFPLSRLLYYQTEELVLISKHGKIPWCFVIDLLSPTNLICTCFMAITPSAIYLPYAFINKGDALINYGLEGLFLFALQHFLFPWNSHSSEAKPLHSKVRLIKWCFLLPPGTHSGNRGCNHRSPIQFSKDSWWRIHLSGDSVAVRSAPVGW